MKIRLFIIFLFAICSDTYSQTLCGTADEGQTLTLTAPAGNTFVALIFASYGTPTGTCGSFMQGGCHASNSATVVQGYLIGNNSASIPATNTTFGDPCVGTVKRLYVEAVYSSGLPLKLISFKGTNHGVSNYLEWVTTNEINTKEFEVERSDDGINFSTIRTVSANNRPGNNYYSFTDNTMQPGTHFYRLKMLDIDGAFTYSNIIRLEDSPSNHFNVFPNPSTNSITLSGLQNKGSIEISDILGRPMQKINVTAQTQTINVADYPDGIYLIKNIQGQLVTVRKFIKQ